MNHHPLQPGIERFAREVEALMNPPPRSPDTLGRDAFYAYGRCLELVAQGKVPDWHNLTPKCRARWIARATA